MVGIDVAEPRTCIFEAYKEWICTSDSSSDQAATAHCLLQLSILYYYP